MRRADDRLVQIDAIQINPDAKVVIDVTMADQDVAGATGNANPMTKLAQQDTGNDGLHNAFNLHTVGVGMLANDLQLADHRHTFMSPLGVTERCWIGGCLVRADKRKCRSLALHQDAAGSTFTSD